MSVELVGHYYEDSYWGGGVLTAAVVWQGLTFGDIKEGRKAPYRIDRNGTPIEWAHASSLRRAKGRITIGVVIIVDSS